VLSHGLKIGKFKGGKGIFILDTRYTISHCRTSQSAKYRNMTTLLHVASRVQAASEAYISVRDFANKSEWKEKFRGELVGTHLHGISIAVHLK
jgi:hypothetical protein